MESLFIYLAKASGLITLFSIAYYMFLKKETFFTSIRCFLIAGIITSFVLPLITISKIVWVNPAPPQEIPTTNTDYVQIVSNNVFAEAFQVNWWYIAVSIYALGVAFFLMRFITDVFKVSVLLKKQNTQQDGKFRLIDSVNNTSPFSFFRYIVFNSASLTAEELSAIIAHEKVHSRQLHSIDMILSQIAYIVLWFNPANWLYKRQVAQNLEFIADAEATKNICDIKSYQKTLLKITLEPQCIAITNHFYQSLIKKRIIMLNKKQSKRLNIIKFAFIVPVLAAFIYFFQTPVVAMEKTIINNANLDHVKPLKDSHKSAIFTNQTITDTIKSTKTTLVKKERTANESVQKTPQEKNKIVVINGVIQTGKDEIVIKGKEINVMELSGEEAVKIYGDKAKQGAIIYTTTDFEPNAPEPKITMINRTFTKTEVKPKINTNITDNVQQMNSNPSRTVTITTLHDDNGNIITNDGVTIYFTITSTTTNIQLNTFKEDLEKAGITTAYSDIKRNSIGKIIAIKISLEDKSIKSKASASWDIKGDKKAIPNIYIGKIKGKLTVSSAE